MDVLEHHKMKTKIMEDYRTASMMLELPYDLQTLVLNLGGGQAIKYINNPSRNIQQRAFSMDPSKAMPYITDKDILMDIIKVYPKAIMYVSNPSKELQLECVKRNRKCFEDIQNPCNEVIQFMRQK